MSRFNLVMNKIIVKWRKFIKEKVLWENCHTWWKVVFYCEWHFHWIFWLRLNFNISPDGFTNKPSCLYNSDTKCVHTYFISGFFLCSVGLNFSVRKLTLCERIVHSRRDKTITKWLIQRTVTMLYLSALYLSRLEYIESPCVTGH